MNPSSFYEISGYGQTKFGELYDFSIENLIVEATEKALSSAKTTINEIEAVFISNMLAGEISSQSHLGSVFSALFGFHGPVIRVEGACASGGLALYTAFQGLKAKSYKKVLVVGAEKMTDYESPKVGELLMQAASQQERDAGLSFPAVYALMASAYDAKYGLSRENLSYGPALMHRNALSNEYAQFQKEFTLEQISNSGMIADPLRLLDCSPITDGAAAVVLSEVGTISADKAYLVDIEVATDTPNIADRDNIYEIKATKLATEKIFNRNNIEASEIGIAELHDCFSIALIIALEDIGFAAAGKGAELIKNVYNGKSDLILNPSGGLKACGHPVGATGVKQAVEVAKKIEQLKSEQNPSDRILGLTQNVGGSGGTSVVSLIADCNFFK